MQKLIHLRWRFSAMIVFSLILAALSLHAQQTQKPVIHAKNWVAITGKPLAATAGSMVFQQGGNAVDAACAMLAATCTMWDVLSWGGETQALIYNPHTGKVIGINALGMAPTGATPAFFKSKGMDVPPAVGPLAAVTPGTPGGLMVMLAEYGTMSLAKVLQPAIDLADGYPLEASTAAIMEKNKSLLKSWPYSRKVFLPHEGEKRETPAGGEVFRQPDLKRMLLSLVEAETKALKAGKSRKDAIMEAYDRFYKGDIAREFTRASQEQGGLITMDDLSSWRVEIEEPLSINYKGIDVYKLAQWTQGPAMLQALNMLENIDLKNMGYNSAQYLHTLYQVMNLAFADRDFYYGDPYFSPEEPIKGLLTKEYAFSRLSQLSRFKNDTLVKPGDPYPFEGKTNPYADWRENYKNNPVISDSAALLIDHRTGFFQGTTTVQAADAAGWVVSMTPSGGWLPACIAGTTGIGMSQRMQSFGMDPSHNPFNVLAPGKRPRVTLTPTLALKDKKPFLSFAVQGGDSQDQNLLQFFLNIVEFGMNVQEAAEAPNMNSYQMRSSFGNHLAEPGRMLLHDQIPDWTRKELRKMGYKLEFEPRTSGPINAIYFDREHNTFWGGSSNFGEDYGIGW